MLYFFYILIAANQLSPANDLNEKVTFKEFQELVQESVAKVPDLKSTWAWNKSTGEGKSIYLGGGALRGLLKLQRNRLKEYSLEEVKKMSVPSVAELMLQKNSDLDFIVLSNIEEKLKADIPKAQMWDTLSEHFYRDSIFSGGTTLEKLFVNPSHILDPHGSLEDFYHGKLGFRITPSDRLNIRWINNNSYTVQILRYLRIYFDIGDLKMDNRTFLTLRQLASDEQKKLHKLSGGSLWRVRKALHKLYLALGSDQKKLGKLLRSLELGRLMELKAINYTGSRPEIKDCETAFSALYFHN